MFPKIENKAVGAHFSYSKDQYRRFCILRLYIPAGRCLKSRVVTGMFVESWDVFCIGE